MEFVILGLSFSVGQQNGRETTRLPTLQLWNLLLAKVLLNPCPRERFRGNGLEVAKRNVNRISILPQFSKSLSGVFVKIMRKSLLNYWNFPSHLKTRPLLKGSDQHILTTTSGIPHHIDPTELFFHTHTFHVPTIPLLSKNPRINLLDQSQRKTFCLRNIFSVLSLMRLYNPSSLNQVQC